ncbi:MAG: hypothetical protein KKF85_16910 [Gammaproteobacteria bacterium]|nr:hypothetical protein [Rhodocyclaceae bacterium]MBU3910875.1 hypothetical protein [Gammaproteobacteria bacterium]MBU4006329.1 hypothetical protein [Gammaproteobacteria bacterium]MBU4097936.1 hypothetical protein [Gammaproteobacteria bacterium]MBU4148642.1 hypothetical protein [Gammaproteobacteria bacterium]
MAESITLQIDPEAEVRIERVRKHLPSGSDLTLIALKGHLLAEEALDDLIRFYCKNPEHLADVEIRFQVKTRLARALSDHVVWPGLWPLLDALNTVRNDLAHNLDSPKLKDRINRFLVLRKELAPLLNDPKIDPSNWDAIAERFRSDISLLLGQLTGAGMMVRTLESQAQPIIPTDAAQ